MRRRSIPVILSAVASLLLSGCYNAFWQPGALGRNNLIVQSRAVPIDWGGEVVRAQFPNDLDYFIGRDNCGAYCLVVKKMDWSTMRMSKVGTALQVNTATGLQLGDGHLVSDPSHTAQFGPGGVYDPSIIRFHNEYWVAWECTVDGRDETPLLAGLWPASKGATLPPHRCGFRTAIHRGPGQ